MSVGRPSSFTQEVTTEICDRLANKESLMQICRSEHMPHLNTVNNWLLKGETKPDEYPHFAEFLLNYTRAREFQADAFAEEIIEIADNAHLTTEHIAKARLQIDSRKWIAGKMRPKKYGDKSTVELGGIDGKEIEVKTKADDELNTRILELAIKTGAGGVTKPAGGKKAKGNQR